MHDGITRYVSPALWDEKSHRRNLPPSKMKRPCGDRKAVFSISHLIGSGLINRRCRRLMALLRDPPATIRFLGADVSAGEAQNRSSSVRGPMQQRREKLTHRRFLRFDR